MQQQETDVAAASINFRLVCRTCLAADVEFCKLEELTTCDDDEAVSYEDCLRYCTASRLVDSATPPPQFPMHICVECSAALQVAYSFIRNAVEAHEILRLKLCVPSTTQRRRNGGLQKISIGRGDAAAEGLTKASVHSVEEARAAVGAADNDEVVVLVEQQQPMRYRCKICGEKVQTKKSLKEHVKLHLDIISYRCRLCTFESKKRSHLSDHYSITHGIEPTREQLKPHTAGAAAATTHIKTEPQQQDEIFVQMEQIHNSPAQPKTIKIQCKQPLFQDQLVQRIQQQQQLKLEEQQLAEQNSLEHHLLIEQQHLEQRQLEQQLQRQEQQQQQQHEQQQQQQHEQQLLLQQQLEMANVITAVDTNGAAIDEFSALPTIASELPDFGSDFNMANEMSVGNEFIVMADGTVEEVMGNGVVIEYINAADDGVTLENGLNLNDLVQVEQPDIDIDCDDMINMDVDDIIIEENVMTTEVVAGTINVQETPPPPLPQLLPPDVPVQNSKKVKCKICALFFVSQEKLKTHMLTHNEIPHFFCDQCPFYTFYKIDLTQHYKTKHKVEPTSKQLQPKNKVKPVEESKSLYTCDLCLYETSIKYNLRKHYMTKHQVDATDVQLRPAIADSVDASAAAQLGMKHFSSVRIIRPDYPNGLQCKKCSKIFYWRNKLKEHYKRHNLEETATALKLTAISPTTTPTSNNLRLSVASTLTSSSSLVSPSDMDIDNTITVAHTPAPTSTVYSVPLDAIPQVVETDPSFDNEIDFDFNFDEDFDEDEDNDDDNEEFQDLLLTSEDDFEDLLEEQSNDSATNNTQRPFCMHCNKKFFSQYQFENHMFVHRGLAPYRCEMCTNLYNTKRALIRHYKAVHKKIPTRDMIQAKGDKVAVDRTPVEHLNLEEQKSITLMCGKCPYESTHLQNLQIHLNTSHGVADENFILQKLPFECPRCIRSYATKLRLIRHLERSHSVATIIQQRQQHQANTPTHTSPHVRSVTNDTNARCAAGNVLIQVNEEEANFKEENFEELLPMNSEEAAETEMTTATTSQAAVTTAITFTGPPTNVCLNTTPLLTVPDAVPLLPPAPPPPSRPPTPPQFECQTCHVFACDSLEALDEHSKIQHADDDHRDNFNFKCDICQCKYKSYSLLKHHLKRHIARKYCCTQCPKTYINRSELETHKLLHSGIMPHKCDMCDKQFRYPHHLKRHRDVTHYGKRVCCPVPECGRIFTTLAQLNIHSWNHNGKLPYKCKYCENFFKKRELLRQHARKVHNVNLTEEEIAEIYRNTVGYTNPHDFTVSVSNGKMLRRNDVEAACAAAVEEETNAAADVLPANILY